MKTGPAIIILCVIVSLLSGCVARKPADITESDIPTESTDKKLTTPKEPTELTDNRNPNLITGKTLEKSIVCDGLTRTYRIYIPTSYTGTPAPLVFVLHYGGGNATIIENVTEMTEKAEEKGFIVAYPNGTGKYKDRLLAWNAGFCCRYPLENDIDDVKFIRTLIEHFEKEYAIDASRIYVTGFCNGAALTHRIGAELSPVIAAIAPVAGTIGGKITEDTPLWTIPPPENPVSVIIFHGKKDEYVPYEGATDKEKGVYSILSVEESVSFWVTHNKCSATPEIEKTNTITIETYTNGEDNTEVVVYTLENGGHAWPGGNKFTGGDEPTTEISATDIIWEFFEDHPKNTNGGKSCIRSEFIDPVATDPLIQPVEVPDAENRNLHHFVAVNTGTQKGILYVHLPGSGGLPEDYQQVSICAAFVGYHVVNLAYCNWPAVRTLTRDETDVELPELIRRERLYGEDVTDIVEVSRADSIENRLIKVLEYIHNLHPEEGWDMFLTDDLQLRWDLIVIGGHSQGAGHAAYLAKEHAMAGVIIFGGPGDFVTGYGPAPWLYYDNVTPPERMFAFTHYSDPFSQAFFLTQRILGFDAFGEVQNVDGLHPDELYSHMLTSTLWAESQNYHSCIIADDYLSYNNGIVYEFVWEYLFQSLLNNYIPVING
jgi:polyhydroxybutyrate depolymerase